MFSALCCYYVVVVIATLLGKSFGNIHKLYFRTKHLHGFIVLQMNEWHIIKCCVHLSFVLEVYLNIGNAIRNCYAVAVAVVEAGNGKQN